MRVSESFAELEVTRENRNTLNSSLSTLTDFAWSVALGQIRSDSQKTYGPYGTDFVRHQRYEFPGAELLKGGLNGESENV